MSLKDDLFEMKKELTEAREENNKQSLAMELLKDSKRANVRIAIAFASVLIVVSTFWAITIVYLIHTLNDIGNTTETNTQEISDFDTVNGNIINRGNIYGKDKTDVYTKD